MFAGWFTLFWFWRPFPSDSRAFRSQIIKTNSLFCLLHPNSSGTPTLDVGNVALFWFVHPIASESGTYKSQISRYTCIFTPSTRHFRLIRAPRKVDLPAYYLHKNTFYPFFKTISFNLKSNESNVFSVIVQFYRYKIRVFFRIFVTNIVFCSIENFNCVFSKAWKWKLSGCCTEPFNYSFLRRISVSE